LSLEKPLDLPLRKCSVCGTVRYCSTDCQREHWKDHKPSCSRPIELPQIPAVPTLFTKGTAREFRGFRSMYAIDDIEEGSVVTFSLPLAHMDTAIVYYLLRYGTDHANELSPRDPSLSPEKAAYQKFKDNHHETGEPGKKLLASLAVTTMNHSANANCAVDVLRANNPSNNLYFLVVYALRDIRKNAELTIDYGPNYKGPGAVADGAASARHRPLFAVEHLEKGIATVTRLIDRNLTEIETALCLQSVLITAKGFVPYRSDGQPVEVKFEANMEDALAYVDEQMQTVYGLNTGKLKLRSGILDESRSGSRGGSQDGSRKAAEP
ncbi:MAG: SET domain-containing protein-lysine N-methyltransferase, partial [Nitrosomonadaceae bacterium]|nr:SET domain-containing protein-lysine N-methyltransferase [Nitrosomonadaceae bacterium]